MITPTPRRGGRGSKRGGVLISKPKYYKESMNQNWNFQRDGREGRFKP